MLCFSKNVDNEVIEDYQNVYHEVVNISYLIDEIRSNILDFSLGFIYNLNRNNLQGREVADFKCIDLINTVANRDQEKDDVFAQATLYIMDTSRCNGIFIKVYNKKVPNSNIKETTMAVVADMDSYILKFKNTIENKLEEIKLKLKNLSKNWQGGNFEIYQKEILKVINNYIKSYETFYNEFKQIEEECNL